jgi:hypothetical protein
MVKPNSSLLISRRNFSRHISRLSMKETKIAKMIGLLSKPAAEEREKALKLLKTCTSRLLLILIFLAKFTLSKSKPFNFDYTIFPPFFVEFWSIIVDKIKDLFV